MNNIGMPIFTAEQAGRVVKGEYANLSLNRWEKRGEIIRLKRGLYLRGDVQIDEMVIANYLYQPSYVSMETVLNQTGVIPDFAGTITSIVTGRPRNFANREGNFGYSRVRTELFFGYEMIKDVKSGLYIKIARPEKALLDYMYVRRVPKLDETRIEWEHLKKTVLLTMAKSYPNWVRKEIRRYV